MRRIASRQNPIVARFRAAARGELDGLLLLDGPHLIGDALGAGIDVREAAVAAEAIERPESRALLERLTAAGIDTVSVTAPVMDALSPVRSRSACVALARQPRHPNGAVFGTGVPLVVVAVDVQDPGNLGAIVRVAEAGGATGVIAAGATADPFAWKALRGSMGSSLRLPVVRTSTASALSDARSHGCRIVATTPRQARPLFDADLRGPLAVVIGGEGAGLPDAVLAEADQQVSIPMQAPVESLNAAVTAALVVYEARRQRQS